MDPNALQIIHLETQGIGGDPPQLMFLKIKYYVLMIPIPIYSLYLLYLYIS